MMEALQTKSERGIKSRPSKSNPRAQILFEKRLKDHAETLGKEDVARALRDHVQRMETRGASSLPSALVARAAELLES